MPDKPEFQVKRGAAVQVKTVSKTGDIEGYGSVFNNVDSGFDIVEPGAFAKSLEERGLPKMLWGHDMWDPPIGIWNEAKEDDRGLYLEGKLNLDMQRGREVHAALKMGSVDGLSIGYLPEDTDIDKRGVRHLKQVDLFEVSVVTFPMNEEARVDAVKQLLESGEMTKTRLERFLRDAGLTRQQAKALIFGGYDELIARNADEGSNDGEQLAQTLGKLSNILRT